MKGTTSTFKKNSNQEESTQKPFKVITQGCIDRIKRSATFDTFMEIHHDLEFRPRGKEMVCKTSGALAIVKKNGRVSMINNGAKLDVPSGGLITQIAYKHKLNPKTKEDFLRVYEIAAGLTNDILEFEDGNTWKANRRKTKREKPLQQHYAPYKPNDDGRDLKVVFQIEYAKQKDGVTNATIEYFRKKIQAPDFQYKDLERFNIKPVKTNKTEGNSTFTYTSKNFAFATISGEQGQNIKVKVPNNPNKDYRNLYASNKGNRLYMYDQLPEKGEVCIISAGETDTIALNYHYNQFGIYAICLGGEKVNIREELLKELRERFNHVLVLFDNDKTGIEQSKKANKNNGIPSIQLWDYATKKEHNDVCDFLEVLSSDEFLKILKYEIDIRHSILQNKENPFSIPIPNCYKIHIDKYIGENNRKGFYQAKPLCLLKSIIRQEKKLLLQSPTGTGKTTALIEMAFDQEFRTKLGVKRTIFFSPINPVCDQTREKIRKTFGFVPKVIDGNYSPTELDEKEPVLICTYQSCAKVMHLIKESEIIVDEGHTLIEWGFNNPYNRMILEYCNMAEKAIVISATPPLQLATQITNYCNFSFCKIIQNPKYAQKIKVFPMIYKGVEREIINSVMQLKTPDGKPIVLKKNNINMLESFQQYVKEKELLSNRLIEDIKDQKGNVYKNAEEYKSATGEDYQKKHEYGYEYGLQPLRVEIFSSKKRKYKEDNENYQTLMLTNNFKTPIDLLLVTSLFDFGINVEPEILQYFLIGFNTASSAIQLPGRSRIDHNTGKNKEINLYVFRKKRKKKKLSSTMDTMQKMEGMYNCWNANAKAANKYDHENMISLKKSEIEPIYKSQITGKYIVNTLGILQMEQSRQESFQTNEQYFQELVGNYDNVELMEVQEIKTETDPLIKEILDSKKTKRVLGKEKAFQILKEKETAKEGEFKPLLEAVYHSTSNHSLKRKIKRSVSIKKEISIDARQIAEETPEIFCNGYFDNHLNKYFKLKSMNIPTDKILPILIDLKNDSQFREFMNSLICGIEIEINKNHSNLLSGESLDRVAMYNQILKKFDPDIDKPIDIYKIYYKMRDIVGEGRYSKMNSYAIPLRELYTVNTCKQEVNTEKSKKRKRKTMYLLYKKDPFELLKANGITKEEYIKMIISNNVEVDFRKEGLL